MNIVALSAVGRQDVRDLWHACFKKFWQDCSWPIVVAERGEKDGYCRWLHTIAKTIGSEYILMTLDDHCINRPVGELRLQQIYEYCKSNAIDVAHLYLPHYKPTLPCSFSGFGEYDLEDPLYKRTLLDPAIWKVPTLLAYLEKIIPRMREEQDCGWVGAYNFELLSSHESRGSKIIGRTDLHLPGDTANASWFSIMDAVRQGQWFGPAISELALSGVVCDTGSRPFYSVGSDPYMASWRKAKDRGLLF